MKTRKALIAALTTLAGSASAMGQTATWNGANADWDSNNWTWLPNGAGFPDSALIDAVQNNGIINIGAAKSFTVRDFTMTGGSLVGPGLLTIKGNLAASGSISTNLQIDGTGAWTGGSWNAAGATTTIGNLATFSIGSGATLDFAGRSIVNNGTVTRNSGTLRSGQAGAGVTNNGLWIDANAADSNYNSDWGAWTFTNSASGTFRKNSNSVSNFVSNAALNNSGLVESVQGTLNISGGGTSFDGARFRAMDTGVVNFSNSYTFSGEVHFEGNAPVNISGGTMFGTSTFTGTNLRWVGGNFNSAGTTTIKAGAAFEIATPGASDMAARAFVNNGTISRSSGTLRSGQAGSGITNNGLWRDVNAVDSGINSDWGAWTFSNTATGVFRKDSASVTNITGSAALDNLGLVEAIDGTLNIGGGGTGGDGSRFRSSGNGRLNFSNNYTFAGTVNFEGDAPVSITGGIMFGTAAFNGTNLRWTGGNFNSNGVTTINSGAMMEIAGSVDSDFSTHQFVNNGTIKHTSGTVRAGQPGSSVVNNALWLESTTADGTVNGAYGVWTFTNAASGTLRKDTPTAAFFNGNARVDNAGLVEVTDGTLNIHSGGSSTSGARFRADGAGVLNFGGTGYTFNDLNLFEGNSSVNLAGGVFHGDHSFQGQNLRWIGGNFNSAGTTTIPTGSAFEIAVAVEADMNTRTLVNNGTINRTGGTLRGGGASVITNQGLWMDSVAADSAINSAYGGSMPFNNEAAGTFRKDSSSQTFFNGNARLNNAGLVDVQAGTLQVHGGGQSTDGARFKASGAGVINFSTYQFTDGIFFEGDSTVNIAGGTITGTHTFNGSNLRWIGGDFNSAGTTTVAAGSEMEIAAVSADLNTRTLVNNGTIDRSVGTLRGGGSSLISNHGLWLETNPADSAINSAFGGSMPFVNESDGVLRKTSASATNFNGNARLNNAGLVDVQDGVLNISGGGQNVDGARFKATGPGVINFSSYQFNDDVLIEGDSSVNLASGTFSGTHTFHGNNLYWTGGNYNNAGTTTIALNSTMGISTGDMAGRVLINGGTVNRTAGTIRGNTNTDVINNGVWNESAGGGGFNSDFGGVWTFHNAADGTLNKVSASSTTFSGVAMANAGLIDVQAGNLAFNGGFTQSAGRTQLSGGTISGATLVFNGGELGGTGTITASVLMNDGSLTPGFSPGLLNITGSLTFGAPATYVVDIAGLLRGTGYDAIDVAGGVTLGGAGLDVHVDPGALASLNVGDIFDVLSKGSAGGITGAFDSLPEGTIFNASGLLELRISYVGGQAGRSVTLQIERIVPTPGAASTMLLCGLIATRRKRR